MEWLKFLYWDFFPPVNIRVFYRVFDIDTSAYTRYHTLQVAYDRCNKQEQKYLSIRGSVLEVKDDERDET